MPQLFLPLEWFRCRPFLNYVLLVMIILPLMATSAHSTSVKKFKLFISSNSQVTDTKPVQRQIATITNITKSSVLEITADPKRVDTIGISWEKRSPITGENNIASRSQGVIEPLTVIKVAPTIEQDVIVSSQGKAFRDGMLMAKKTEYTEFQPIMVRPNPPLVEEVGEEEFSQEDPIGSPHPIPWEWIVSTHKIISANGGSGVRHYRSVPIVSPDGRYVAYSRVQLEVKPEMYNSTVTSVMFLEDTETKRLRVMARTAPINDPLLQRRTDSPSTDDNHIGKIGVLVPVSWSEHGDRFLARKFEGRFNTGDSTDHALIWDRENNHINTVTPTVEDSSNQRISVLLGWSKNQPEHTLFRAGEMGEEDWPLVQVNSNGQTVQSSEGDQPITYGKKLTEIWQNPQVASR